MLRLDAGFGISVFGPNFCLGADMSFAVLRGRGLRDTTGFGRLQIKRRQRNRTGGDYRGREVEYGASDIRGQPSRERNRKK